MSCVTHRHQLTGGKGHHLLSLNLVGALLAARLYSGEAVGAIVANLFCALSRGASTLVGVVKVLFLLGGRGRAGVQCHRGSSADGVEWRPYLAFAVSLLGLLALLVSLAAGGVEEENGDDKNHQDDGAKAPSEQLHHSS